MDQLAQWIDETWGIGQPLQWHILFTILTILLLGLGRSIVLRMVARRTEDIQVRYQWQKASGYVAFVLGALLLGRIWIEGFHSIATYLGLVSAGLAIALKDPVVNLAAWLFIIWRRPFEVGDRIQIGDRAGDVIDIRIFQFTLLEIGNWVDADQSTGRIIHIPNGRVFTETQALYTRGFPYIWNEIPVLITFESNWKEAKSILGEVAKHHAEPLSEDAQQRLREAARRYLIFYSKLTPTVYTSVRESGVLLTIRYLCDPRRRRSSDQAMWEEILTEFGARNDIDFAYPTRRLFDNAVEGKPRTRPASVGPPETDDSKHE